MPKSLLPIILEENDPSRITVSELKDVLGRAIENGEIRNVAITGPFGSGKSSIIKTLCEEHKEFEYLHISLATLKANEEGDNGKSTNNPSEEEIESLNRKIEYSVLQQLIYREKAETLCNSRFKRIVNFSGAKLFIYTLLCIVTIIAFLIVFEPSFVRVETICNKLDFGCKNIIADICGAIWLLLMIGISFWHIIRAYSNSKLNKLNLKDGEIEIKEDKSIFNKHLDEILYFFQVTKYNVVIIEDLDRFETESIFLQLRELNQLINESKTVGRNIVFLYAIKDDIFENESRTKFFDYIITVIPVINPSNSKDKLKNVLKAEGLDANEISDDDLSEMAFFIQDMRILINIVNEYRQYRQRLYMPSSNNLNMTKLLAMIVYKNFYPKDFALLHRREGFVYKCISAKQSLVKEALKKLDADKKELKDSKKMYEDNNHLKENDLRLLFLYEVNATISKPLESIRIDGKDYDLKQISNDADSFEKMRKQDKTTYIFYNGYSREAESKSIDFKKIAAEMKFEERMELIKDSVKVFNAKESEIKRKTLEIQSLTLSALINTYNFGDNKVYKDLGLPPMIDVFIRRGYIDEDYYDYISFFYPDMISSADRDLILSIKQRIKKDYTTHIDKIDNFVKELKDYMFENDAILNVDLLDYVALKKDDTSCGDMFVQMMRRLERDNAPLDFLAQYYQFGKQQKTVFTEFINWNSQYTWRMIEEHTNDDEKQLLRESWFKFCDAISEPQSQWLSANYSFLSSRAENIGMNKCKELINECDFEKLDNNNEKLLSEVIEGWNYIISAENLCLIANYLNGRNAINPNNLNLTRITDTKHSAFISYIKDRFASAFTLFSTTCKDESANNILYILNSKEIESEQKVNYLTGQRNQIDDISSVDEDYWIVAIKSKNITPLWENVDSYFQKEKEITKELVDYIEEYHIEFEKECTVDSESKDSLFKALLGDNILSITAYHSICNAFDLVFDGYDALSQLEVERLKILLNDNKIAFSEDNNAILNRTSLYPEYLIHYHLEFLNNLDKEYDINFDCAISLLKSNTFSLKEKRSIISIISSQVFSESQVLADLTIDILLAVNDITSIGTDKLINIVQAANNEKNKVYMVTQMLSNYSYDNDSISTILSLLDGQYLVIAERQKRPILEDNDWNRALLTKLKEVGFISSMSIIENGIRVYPKSL